MLGISFFSWRILDLLRSSSIYVDFQPQICSSRNQVLSQTNSPRKVANVWLSQTQAGACMRFITGQLLFWQLATTQLYIWSFIGCSLRSICRVSEITAKGDLPGNSSLQNNAHHPLPYEHDLQHIWYPKVTYYIPVYIFVLRSHYLYKCTYIYKTRPRGQEGWWMH